MSQTIQPQRAKLEPSKDHPLPTTIPDLDLDIEKSPTPSIHSSSSSTHHTTSSHASHSDDETEPAPIPLTHYTSHLTIPDEVYERLPPHRKIVIVALLSFCSFLAPMSSTAVLSAIPEVAAQYGTSGAIINVSNALYMAFMGVSPCVWGPLSQVYGRRWISLITSILFLACSIGTAFAPNLAAFFVFRILTAFEGTSFLIVGAACIGDIYRPVERATGMGWFLSGTLIGPALGPLIGGVLVTYTTWRSIFYLQSGLAFVAAISTYFLLPETAHHLKSEELVNLPTKRKAVVLAGMINPWRVLKLFRYRNLLCVAAASSALVWNMYSLLTPIRYVLNPRFHLTTPTQSALFYLAPGAGYLTGTFFGGRYADATVKKWILLRPNNTRVPEDRLRACLPSLGLVIPICMLLYGWSVEKEFGGVALPVVCMFVQGVAQLFCFPSLNTYCLDVMGGKGAEVIAGNYVVRYMFAAMGTALVLPAVEGVGVGWFSTVSAGFLVVSALAVWASIIWGGEWRERDGGKKRKVSEETEKKRDVEAGVEDLKKEESGATSETNATEDSAPKPDQDKGEGDEMHSRVNANLEKKDGDMV